MSNVIILSDEDSSDIEELTEDTSASRTNVEIHFETLEMYPEVRNSKGSAIALNKSSSLETSVAEAQQIVPSSSLVNKAPTKAVSTNAPLLVRLADGTLTLAYPTLHYKCKFCEIMFDSEDNLKLHISNEHFPPSTELKLKEKLSRYKKCPLCFLHVQDLDFLKRHFKRNHPKEYAVLRTLMHNDPQFLENQDGKEYHSCPFCYNYAKVLGYTLKALVHHCNEVHFCLINQEPSSITKDSFPKSSQTSGLMIENPKTFNTFLTNPVTKTVVPTTGKESLLISNFKECNTSLPGLVIKNPKTFNTLLTNTVTKTVVPTIGKKSLLISNVKKCNTRRVYGCAKERNNSGDLNEDKSNPSSVKDTKTEAGINDLDTNITTVVKDEYDDEVKIENVEFNDVIKEENQIEYESDIQNNAIIKEDIEIFPQANTNPDLLENQSLKRIFHQKYKNAKHTPFTFKETIRETITEFYPTCTSNFNDPLDTNMDLSVKYEDNFNVATTNIETPSRLVFNTPNSVIRKRINSPITKLKFTVNVNDIKESYNMTNLENIIEIEDLCNSDSDTPKDITTDENITKTENIIASNSDNEQKYTNPKRTNDSFEYVDVKKIKLSSRNVNCPHCEFFASDLETLFRHVYETHNQSSFIKKHYCALCKWVDINVIKYLEHLRQHPEDMSSFIKQYHPDYVYKYYVNKVISRKTESEI